MIIYYIPLFSLYFISLLNHVNHLTRDSNNLEVLIKVVPVLVLVRDRRGGLNIRRGGDTKLVRRLLGGRVRLAHARHGGLVAVNLLLLRLAADELAPELVALVNVFDHGGGVLEFVANHGVEAAALDDLVVLLRVKC